MAKALVTGCRPYDAKEGKRPGFWLNLVDLTGRIDGKTEGGLKRWGWATREVWVPLEQAGAFGDGPGYYDVDLQTNFSGRTNVVGAEFLGEFNPDAELGGEQLRAVR